MIRPHGKRDQAVICAHQCEVHFRRGRGPLFNLRCYWGIGSGVIVVVEEEWQKMEPEQKLTWMREKMAELYQEVGGYTTKRRPEDDEAFAGLDQDG